MERENHRKEDAFPLMIFNTIIFLNYSWHFPHFTHYTMKSVRA